MASRTSEGFPRSELHALLARLQHIETAAQSYAPLVLEPPIIYATTTSPDNLDENKKDALPGLRLLKEGISRECTILKTVLEGRLCQSKDAPQSFSTNAPYLIAVWQELINSCYPVAVYRTFSIERSRVTSHKRTQSGRVVKVDVVSEGGERWIRVNTIKNSRLMVEFREMDSYLTSSSSGESDSEHFTHNEGSNNNQGAFDNSVLRIARELLAAAVANPLPVSGHVPRITIRLTRLSPTFVDSSGVEADPRIAYTIERLQEMGIDVQLGEQPDVLGNSQLQQQYPLPHLDPTLDINLDLSALIALVSDTTHAPLPLTFDEARARFRHRKVSVTKEIESGANERMSARANGYDVTTEIEVDDRADELLQNDENGQTRALSRQVIQEMYGGLLEDMHSRLSALCEDSPNSVVDMEVDANASAPRSSHSGSVMFWTTEEASQRCLDIVAKIGGPREQRRARALLATHECVGPPESIKEAAGRKWDKEATERVYWEHSRYPPAYLSLVPVHIIPSWLTPTSSPDDGTSSLGAITQPLSLVFFSALSATCTELLADSTDKELCAKRLAVSTEGQSSPFTLDVTQGLSVDRHPDILAAPVLCTAKLTRHTVASMYAGASRRWTTLTANRASIRELLKRVKKRAKGSEPATWHVFGDHRCGRDTGAIPRIQAAIWVVDPRSLAEEMRKDGSVA